MSYKNKKALLQIQFHRKQNNHRGNMITTFQQSQHSFIIQLTKEWPFP